MWQYRFSLHLSIDVHSTESGKLILIKEPQILFSEPEICTAN